MKTLLRKIDHPILLVLGCAVSLIALIINGYVVPNFKSRIINESETIAEIDRFFVMTNHISIDSRIQNIASGFMINSQLQVDLIKQIKNDIEISYDEILKNGQDYKLNAVVNYCQAISNDYKIPPKTKERIDQLENEPFSEKAVNEIELILSSIVLRYNKIRKNKLDIRKKSIEEKTSLENQENTWSNWGITLQALGIILLLLKDITERIKINPSEI